MLDTPYITHADPVQAAVIRFDIPRAEIMHVMGPGMAELMSTAAAQDIGPAGRCYSYHFRMQPDRFDFEIGVPVSSPVAPAGRVQPGALPAARVARAVLHGPYDGLPDAWGQLMAWIEAQGLRKAPGLWEVYVSGPDLDPDPSSWRTELNQPLTD